MGMFDYLTCELPMPDGQVVKEAFQTKSLWCSMDLFTITATGRLIFHRRRYSASPMPEHVVDIDMDYHGDIKIHGNTSDGAYVRYAVRFTRGTVESVQPVDSLPEIHQLWLMERGQ